MIRQISPVCVCVSAVNNKKGSVTGESSPAMQMRKAKSAKPQMEEMDANMHEREKP